MSVESKIETLENENIIDNLSDPEKGLNENKLAALKAKMQAKEKEQKMGSKIIAEKERSIKLGVIGSGQAGSRLAECYFKLGYNAIVLNTAMQDLKSIAVPDSNKLLMEYGLGGAAKELEIGRGAAESYRKEILELVHDKLSDSQVNVLCLSLGGGSGAGSCEPLVDVLSEIGKPIVVMTILPMDSDDAQTKANALETLSKLSRLAQQKKISNLIVVDNAKIEAIYQNVSQMNFFDVANKAIVDVIDIYNTLSMQESTVKALDSAEWGKLLIDGEGLSVYGELEVTNYQDETAIAEAIISNLNSNMLASGFDLKQARYAGVMIVANEKVWKNIPAAAVNYGMSMIQDHCGNIGLFKGIYTVDVPNDSVKIYSFFSGLGLPESRVEQLKKEAQQRMLAVKEKDEQRNLTLNLDTGVNETVSAAQKIKDKIAIKNSSFGKLMNPGVRDRRS
jgi:cell division GTPase FtsZ